MRRFWRFATASRKRKVFSLIAVLALAASTTALAAFIINSGANGSGSGSLTTQTTTNPAITITVTGSPVLDPQTATHAAGTIKNNTNVSETLNTSSASFTSSPSNCASFLHFDPAQSRIGGGGFQTMNGLVVPASTTTTVTGGTNDFIDLFADNAAPPSCAGATWTATFSGTTTP